MKTSFTYDPPLGDVPILFSDAAILLVNKPAGLLSVPGRLAEHHDSLATRLQAHDADVRVVHRLDMDTSGVMVFARNAAAHRALSIQFEARRVDKVYRAWVTGDQLGDAGEVALPLIVDWPNRPLQKVCFETGKPAQTKWQVLVRQGGKTLVELQPVTGRSHQLRVHMAKAQAPIVGDRFYGVADDAARLMLHAWALSFAHPVTGETMDFTCEDAAFLP